jgi:hypothetical protein
MQSFGSLETHTFIEKLNEKNTYIPVISNILIPLILSESKMISI